uniref:Uncharacterized protein n=1 Tax=Opuntia streptacantha TaxID=393608 RepID=A0A7C9DZX9_OPUST
MAEGKETSQSPDPSPLFLEVECISSGKVRRFAQGTKAGFALSLINNKLEAGAPLGLYIEAVKDGEDPITFGPSSVLVSYGNGWKLQTVVDYQGFKKREYNQASNASLNKKQVKEPAISFLYIGKIILAFGFIFLLGGVFTLALENLPWLLTYISSSL